MLRGLLPLIALAACSPAELPLLIDETVENRPATLVGHEPQMPIRNVRNAIRAEAQRLYGDECGTVTVPDRSIVPVEFTGGGHPEYAVLFGRVICRKDGGATGGRWQGTGGVVVQFWLASGGPPRLLLEHSMHGFTATGEGIVSEQHGGFCPGGTGPNICVVQYRWNDRDRTLEVVDRDLVDGIDDDVHPPVEWSYQEISG